jgi:hypothetical protein
MGSKDAEDETLRAQAAAIFGEAAHLPRTQEQLLATIVPHRSLGGESAAALVAKLRSMEGVSVGELIGQGGMGLVHAGVQDALGRAVAVKTLRPELRSEATTLRLLREAWVTGTLDHPNVVPVYDIALGADGDPHIVLKKIDGVAWSQIIHDEEAIRERFGALDPLEWNVRTLLQVANAIRFAHSRGVVHRDLKPENVMIGAFGEVYVLDWGLAVALEDDGSGRLPLASEARALAGTPAYMAPEMLGGDGVTARTDVYLLGAVLYEIACGHAPHAGSTMIQLYAKIMTADPPIPSSVSRELAAIVRRAMQREPAERFESVEALRAALEAFLEHRGSLKLAEEASARLRDLEDERAKASADPNETRLRLYHLFGECRFGFLAALRVWPENEDAQRGLARATELMVELELANGDPRAAALLLAELAPRPAELASRVEAARRAWEQEETRRAALARDHDPTAGRRMRLSISAGLGIVWTLLPWAGFVLERSGAEMDQRLPILSSALMLACALPLAYFARRSLSRTVLNRSLVRVVGVVLAAQLALFIATYALDITYAQTRPLVLLLYTVCNGVTAAAIERRLWPSSMTYAFVFAASVAWPSWAFPLESMGHFVLTITVLAIWSRLDAEIAAPRRTWADFLQRQRARETAARSEEMPAMTAPASDADRDPR